MVLFIGVAIGALASFTKALDTVVEIGSKRRRHGFSPRPPHRRERCAGDQISQGGDMNPSILARVRSRRSELLSSCPIGATGVTNPVAISEIAVRQLGPP